MPFLINVKYNTKFLVDIVRFKRHYFSLSPIKNQIFKKIAFYMPF